MKVYTNKNGVKFKLKTKYLVRHISKEGLVKCFESYGEELYYYGFDSEEEAYSAIGIGELHEAIIIPKISIDYVYD